MIVRLLQLNIWQGRVFRNLHDFIASEPLDILCLQEVVWSEQEFIFPGLRLLTLQRIQQLLPDYDVFFSPCFESVVDGSVIKQGNVILSRYPIEFSKTVETKVPYETGFIGNDHQGKAQLPQNMQVSEINIGGNVITVANHHGHWEPDSRGTDYSYEKMQIVAQELAAVSTPLILSGDFNVVQESHAMSVFDGLLENKTYHEARTTLSPLGFPKDIVCDHILTRGVEVHESIIDQRVVSDHLPVIIKFSL